MSTQAGIRVTVRAGEPLWRAFGQHRISIDLPASATLADLLAALSETYPDFSSRFRGEDLGHRHPYRLYVNLQQAPGHDLAQRLNDGDTIHIVIPISGG